MNLDEVTVALRENERMIITLNVDDEDNAIAVVESEQGRNHSRKHNERRERDSVYETDKESFMDVLAALIVSEEFQGIVASETGFSKVLDNGSNVGSRVSNSQVPNVEPIPSSSDNSEGSGGIIIL